MLSIGRGIRLAGEDLLLHVGEGGVEVDGAGVTDGDVMIVGPTGYQGVRAEEDVEEERGGGGGRREEEDRGGERSREEGLVRIVTSIQPVVPKQLPLPPLLLLLTLTPFLPLLLLHFFMPYCDYSYVLQTRR